jgi:hypothetical protein
MKMGPQSSKYVKNALHYLKNASRFVDAGDAEKSSEFLWGSMAQALKAVADSKGIHLRSHREVRDYALALAKELNDKSIYDSFLHASYLHSNFYEAELELKDVRIIAEEIKTAVGELLNLIPQKS